MNGSARNAAIYGGLLAVFLGVAWVRYTAEPEPDLKGKVVLLQGEADKVESVVWQSEKDKAFIERKSDERGDYLWVTYTKWEKKRKSHKDAEDDDATPEPTDEDPLGDAAEEGATTPEDEAAAPAEEGEEMVEKTQVFKAGENGDKLLESLSPMLAIRKLVLETPEQVEKAGLTTPVESIEIVRKGRTTRLEVGGEVYGTRDRYVRNTATGDVYLVDDEVIRPLKYARTRLPDRNLWSVANDQIASAVVESGSGATLEAEQKNAQDKAKATWVRASAPEENDEQLKTWMDKALKLKGTSYANPDEMPQDLQLRFKLTLRDAKGESETVEVLQEGEKGEWWARSGYTRGLLKLLKGPTSSLAEDVGSLVEE